MWMMILVELIAAKIMHIKVHVIDFQSYVYKVSIFLC